MKISCSQQTGHLKKHAEDKVQRSTLFEGGRNGHGPSLLLST